MESRGELFSFSDFVHRSADFPFIVGLSGAWPKKRRRSDGPDSCGGAEKEDSIVLLSLRRTDGEVEVFDSEGTAALGQISLSDKTHLLEVLREKECPPLQSLSSQPEGKPFRTLRKLLESAEPWQRRFVVLSEVALPTGEKLSSGVELVVGCLPSVLRERVCLSSWKAITTIPCWRLHEQLSMSNGRRPSSSAHRKISVVHVPLDDVVSCAFSASAGAFHQLRELRTALADGGVNIVPYPLVPLDSSEQAPLPNKQYTARTLLLRTKTLLLAFSRSRGLHLLWWPPNCRKEPLFQPTSDPTVGLSLYREACGQLTSICDVHPLEVIKHGQPLEAKLVGSTAVRDILQGPVKQEPFCLLSYDVGCVQEANISTTDRHGDGPDVDCLFPEDDLPFINEQEGRPVPRPRRKANLRTANAARNIQETQFESKTIKRARPKSCHELRRPCDGGENAHARDSLLVARGRSSPAGEARPSSPFARAHKKPLPSAKREAVADSPARTTSDNGEDREQNRLKCSDFAELQRTLRDRLVHGMPSEIGGSKVIGREPETPQYCVLEEPVPDKAPGQPAADDKQNRTSQGTVTRFVANQATEHALRDKIKLWPDNVMTKLPRLSPVSSASESTPLSHFSGGNKKIQKPPMPRKPLRPGSTASEHYTPMSPSSDLHQKKNKGASPLTRRKLFYEATDISPQFKDVPLADERDAPQPYDYVLTYPAKEEYEDVVVSATGYVQQRDFLLQAEADGDEDDTSEYEDVMPPPPVNLYIAPVN